MCCNLSTFTKERDAFERILAVEASNEKRLCLPYTYDYFILTFIFLIFSMKCGGLISL